MEIRSFLGRQLRAHSIDGDVWFVAKDVCNILGLQTGAGITNQLRNLADDERRVVTFRDLDPDRLTQSKPPFGRIRMPPRVKVNIINEPGLYRLVQRSDKPQARQFQDWIVRDVIPSIRKNGTYTLPATKKIEVLEGVRAVASLLRHEADLLDAFAEHKDNMRNTKVAILDVRRRRKELSKKTTLVAA